MLTVYTISVLFRWLKNFSRSNKSVESFQEKWRKIENGVLEKAKSVPKAKEVLSDCIAAKERNGFFSIFFQFFKSKKCFSFVLETQDYLYSLFHVLVVLLPY